MSGSIGYLLHWRADYSRLRYTPMPTPADIELALHEHLDHSGLHFGAFDFALDAGGQWRFLEFTDLLSDCS
ncbi:hypothetical protein [Streptomyces sp. NPDC057403]|uniref:hypothetical protein n=1 Tax=Streptomyces sp. NPDC057403 TaxID=3346119 RepID=UPI003694B40E